MHNALNCYSITVHADSTYAAYPSISRDPERVDEVYAINIPWKEGKFPSEALNDSTAPQLSALPASMALLGFVQFSSLLGFYIQAKGLETPALFAGIRQPGRSLHKQQA